MKYLFMTAVLLALSSGRILLAADTVPEFKIESCRAAEGEPGSAGRNVEACFQDEQTAKDTLRENWNSYDHSQRNHRQLLMKAGGKRWHRGTGWSRASCATPRSRPARGVR